MSGRNGVISKLANCELSPTRDVAEKGHVVKHEAQKLPDARTFPKGAENIA